MSDPRDTSLEWAEQCRSARHEVRDELLDGRRSLAQVLSEDRDDEFRGRVRVQWILESVPGVRKIDTRRRLERLGIEATRTLAGLTPDEIETLLAPDTTPGSGSRTGSGPGGSVDEGVRR